MKNFLGNGFDLAHYLPIPPIVMDIVKKITGVNTILMCLFLTLGCATGKGLDVSFDKRLLTLYDDIKNDGKISGLARCTKMSSEVVYRRKHYVLREAQTLSFTPKWATHVLTAPNNDTHLFFRLDENNLILNAGLVWKVGSGAYAGSDKILFDYSDMSNKTYPDIRFRSALWDSYFMQFKKSYDCNQEKVK